MSAPQPNKIPVQQIDLDATKHRVHPRFVTGFYQNIRVISMYFFWRCFCYYHGYVMTAGKLFGSMYPRSTTTSLG